MSRRSFPRIDPAALRDHADEARVERVWERIEQDLNSRGGAHGFDAFSPSARARRSTLVYAAIAATFAAFGGGLLLGKATWERKTPSATLVAAPIIEKSTVEVLAAGSQLRSFPLQGGGQITLSPGATVEVERTGSALTLSLLQGDAAVETHRTMAIVAGEARLNTQAGSSVSVGRNQDDVDVRVTDGKVSVTSPLGVTQELGKGDRVQMPIHTAVSSAPANVPPHRTPVLAARRPPGQRPTVVKGAVGSEWLTRHNAGDDDGALTILKKQGINATIDSAGSAAELMGIAEIMSGKGRDQSAEVRAWERLVEGFASDQRASLAASGLADIYQSRGDAGHAKEYRDKIPTLVKNATTGSDSLFCNLIRREADKTKAALMAKEYLDKYPNGECREEFERLVQGDAPGASANPLPSAVPAEPAPPSSAP